MGMVPAAVARFPDAFVGKAPMLYDVVAESDEHLLHFAIEVSSAKCELGGGIDDLTVHIKLQLVPRRITDSHRGRVLVSAQPLGLTFLLGRIAKHGVEDSQFRLGKPRGVEHPVEE